MDLELKMQEVPCCERTQCMVFSHEETLETAIPEYCPDVHRIVDAAGQLKIREKKLSAGRLTVTGAVKMTVLYTSEESAGLRSLVMPVPFTCVMEDVRLQECRHVCVSARLLLAEGRIVTARKLYVRAMIEFEAEGIRATKHRICCDVPEDCALQIRQETEHLCVLSDTLERSFHFHHEFLPPDGCDTPEDLLLDRITLCVTGCQRMGHKLIVKGEMHLSTLYRNQMQKTEFCDVDLPFSQILDASELPEEGEYQTDAWVEESDVRLVRTDGTAGFGVTARIGLLIRVYEKRELRYITDLYSTQNEMAVQEKCELITADQPMQTWRRDVTEQLQFGQEKPFACVSGVECGAVTITSEGERTVLHTNLRVKILHLDESGAPASTECTLEASIQLPYMPDSARAQCAPIEMNMGRSSCEMRIPVDFFTRQSQMTRIPTITAATLTESEPKEMPSLVLRRIDPQDTLWDIAKAYRADPDTICRANGLDSDAPLPGGMLLIPKVRK